MDTIDYPSPDEEHSHFVTSENGTTSVEILSIMTSCSLFPFLASLLFPWFVPVKLTVRCGSDIHLHRFLRFLIEFPIVVITPLLLLTFLTSEVPSSNMTLSLSVTITLFATILLILTFNHTLTRPTWTTLLNEWNQLKDEDIGWNTQNTRIESPVDNKNNEIVTQPRKSHPHYPFLTNARGAVNYLAILGILAVDFPIFPRRFAKTRKYGVSHMDFATASFIIINGIVSPEAKDCRTDFKKSILSSIPLLLLGVGRLVTVKGTQYHEVVEEYGVHWNFFFTLAAVKILSTIIFALFPVQSALKLCAGLGIIYEACLLKNNLQENYLLNPKMSRQSSLIDANREGIYSSLGYLSIYFASVYGGQRLFVYRKNASTVKDWAKYLLELLWQGSLVWLFYFLWTTYVNPSSRRAGNLSYILWAIAINTTGLFINVFLSFTQTLAQKKGLLHGPMISYHLYLKNLKETGQYFDSKEGPGSKNINRTDNFHKLASNKETKDDHLLVDQSLDEFETKLEQLKLEKLDGATSEDTDDGREIDEDDFDKLEKELEALGHLISGDLQETTEKDTKEDKETEVPGAADNKFVCLPDLTKASLFYEAICFNGLFVFLLGNLLTGLVNYSIVPMYARPTVSSMIMLCYASAIYFTSFLLYWFNIKLKFW